MTILCSGRSLASSTELTSCRQGSDKKSDKKNQFEKSEKSLVWEHASIGFSLSSKQTMIIQN